MSNAAYVRQAGSIDLLEIRSSELALQRSRSARVRDYASMMIAAHNGTSAQLSLAGRRLNLLPSPRLHGRHEAMLAELSSAQDFDAVYLRLQSALHHEALALHAGYAARGASPTLRPIAAAFKSIIEQHIRMLRHL